MAKNMSIFSSNIITWQVKSECSDWFILGQDFAIRAVSMETVKQSSAIQNKHGPSAM